MHRGSGRKRVAGALRCIAGALGKDDINVLDGGHQCVFVIGVRQVVQDGVDGRLRGVGIEGEQQGAGGTVVGDGGHSFGGAAIKVSDRRAVVEQLQARWLSKAAADRDAINPGLDDEKVVGSGRAGMVNDFERGTVKIGFGRDAGQLDVAKRRGSCIVDIHRRAGHVDTHSFHKCDAVVIQVADDGCVVHGGDTGAQAHRGNAPAAGATDARCN